MSQKERTIGELIGLKRAELRMTQAEAAAEMGVDRGTLIRWESDRVYPVRRLHGAVATWLGCSVSDLPAKKRKKVAKKAA